MIARSGASRYLAKELVPDFVVHTLSLALEIKLIKSFARVREVVDEINADIAAYTKRYRSLMFIVYDLGYIRDELEFRYYLESSGVAFVIVVKH